MRLASQVEFIKNEDNKYVRLLGAFYLRLVGRPLEVYEYLEVRAPSWRLAHSHRLARLSAALSPSPEPPP